MLCILNVELVPTFRHFLLEINQGLKHAIVYNKQKCLQNGNIRPHFVSNIRLYSYLGIKNSGHLFL